MADSGVGVMTSRPTGYVGGDQSADRVCRSDDQSADSGVEGLTSQPTSTKGIG